jgi:hypothetical protein
VFRKPGEESGDESDERPQSYELPKEQDPHNVPERPTPLPVAEQAKITIHEDD